MRCMSEESSAWTQAHESVYKKIKVCKDRDIQDIPFHIIMKITGEKCRRISRNIVKNVTSTRMHLV